MKPAFWLMYVGFTLAATVPRAVVAGTSTAREVSGSRARVKAFNLRYDSTLASAGFPSPLLRGSVNGHDVWFLVDTGAGVHTLARWLVAAAGMRTRATGDTAQGTTGHSIEIQRAERVRIRMLEGSTLQLEEAAVAEFPAIFAELSIGGLLSPQLLARRTEWVLLDLRIPELRIRSTAMHVPDPQSLSCTNKQSAFRNRQYAVRTYFNQLPATVTLDSEPSLLRSR
jgi:hypothetical protein